MSNDDREGGEGLEVADVAARYENVAAGDVNGWLLDLLPAPPGHILDVGSGTGRDAAWLTALGYRVVAVEPNRAMRREAERRRPNKQFALLDDRLPDLPVIFRNGLCFDFILLNAVWMFITPAERERAFRKLATLLKPRGVLAFTLRRGPVEVSRGMHPVSAEEIERLAQRHGAYVERTGEAPDHLGRSEIAWTQMAVQLNSG